MALDESDKPASARALLEWLALLERAGSPAEVVALANAFVEGWEEGDLLLLPAGCIPPRLGSAGQVAELAYSLTRTSQSFAGSLGATVLLDRMTTFFARASQRLAHLAYLRVPAG